MEEHSIDYKREQIISLIKNKRHYIYLALLLIIIIYSSSVRLSNLPLLLDPTTNDYTTADPDASLFLRYSQEIVKNGDLPEIDKMRFYPLGFPTIQASPIIPYTIAWLYKIFHIFNPSITVAFADVALYPIFFFILGCITFYFLVSKLFNPRVALLATFILVIMPQYLFRTMTGVGDKEVFGMVFMYLALFLYLLALHSENNRKAIIYGLLAGISTGVMNLAWNGANFVFMLIALNSLLSIFLDRFTKKDVYLYASWLVSATLLLMMFRYGIKGILQVMLFSITTGVAYFALLVGIILLVLHTKRFENFRNKITQKIPLGFSSLLLAFIVAAIFTAIFISPSFIFDKITSIKDSLIHPFGLGRLTLTVAESYQPYFTDWVSNFSWTYLLIFLTGSVYLFYQMTRPLKKLQWKLTAIYTLFLVLFIPTRYASSSKVFNGETFISNFLYIGSLIAFISFFIIIYLYSYLKNKELFEELTKLNKNYVFLFIWMLLMIVGARGAIRLFFTLVPITAILASHIIVEAYEKLFKLKDKLYKYSAIIIITFLLLSPFPFYNGVLIKFAKSTSSAARYTGPAYNEQWQYAMDWVRKNTPEDAVFTHWWDYGYWVQTGGQRATIVDGGNNVAYWDTLVARYVLTTPDEEEALVFMKTHDSNYLLIDPTDVGKYPAYSNIGSDENLDRYSQIPVFSVDPKDVQETRNETVYLYQGVAPLDEDFIHQGKLYPKGAAGVVAIKIPAIIRGDDAGISQPTAFLAYRDQAIEIPLQCVSMGDIQYTFSGDGIKACFKLIPTFDNNVQNRNLNFPAGGLYISERARRALWVRLYLLEEQIPNFKLVYTDESQIPLALYQGQQIGPLKIW